MKKDSGYTVILVIAAIVIVYSVYRAAIAPRSDSNSLDKVPAYILDYMDYYDEKKHTDSWRAGYAQGFADAVESIDDWIFDHARSEYEKIWDDGYFTGVDDAGD